jgi:cell division protein FtsQ
VPAARRRPTARTAALPARRSTPALRDLLPSGRSLLVGLLLIVLAIGGYAVARGTSIFAVRTIDVRGGTPAIRAEVRAALGGEVGENLLAVNGQSVARRLATLPDVRSFTYDRAFPHTLRVVVRREVPVLVVRAVPGSSAYLVAASGKVTKTLPHARLSSLPRLWVKSTVPISVGHVLPANLLPAATSLAPLRTAGLPGGVRTVSFGDGGLTLTLGGGLEVRLGDPGDVRLKLAIARRILRSTGAATAGQGYLDVSVPQRPVLYDNSQVGG